MLRLQPQHPLPRPESLPYLGHGTIRDIPTLLVEPQQREKVLLVDFKSGIATMLLLAEPDLGIAGT